MEINILYSKDNADHLKTANNVRKAVKNLGMSATIIERNTSHETPQVVVDGYDLIFPENGRASLSFEKIRAALEQSAWMCI